MINLLKMIKQDTGVSWLQLAVGSCVGAALLMSMFWMMAVIDILVKG